MNHEYWYLSRAAGFTAYLLLFVAAALGILVRTPLPHEAPPPGADPHAGWARSILLSPGPVTLMFIFPPPAPPPAQTGGGAAETHGCGPPPPRNPRPARPPRCPFPPAPEFVRHNRR